MKTKIFNKYNTILKEHFGYDSLKEEQYKIIYNIVHKRRDVLAVLATGFGKSICYQLPFLLSNKSVIVISPLISLMDDQIKQLNELNIPNCCFNETTTWKNGIKGDILKGNFKIIYMTPEYCIRNTEFIEELYEEHDICCFAIDESHCVSQWSDKSFRPEYGELNVLREIAPEVPILALTATASDKIQEDITSTLCMLNPYKVSSSFDRSNLYIHIDRKTNNINEDLRNILYKYKDDAKIIYAKTRDMTNKICESIKELGIKSLPYHAGLSTDERMKIQQKFMDNKINTIVATIAFGMGINHRNIRLVVQYGCSNNIEAYYQEIGRAGRDGENSDCYMYYSAQDFRLNRFFLSELQDQEKKDYRESEIVKMEKFVYSTDCRRKLILNHFGEEHNGKCMNCDNCKKVNNMIEFDFTNYVLKLFSVMKKLDNSFGSTQYILILRGSKSKKITQDMKLMKEYDTCNGKSEKWWKELVRLLIANSYLYEKAITNGFGSKLLMTKTAYELLKYKKELKINVDSNFLRL